MKNYVEDFERYTKILNKEKEKYLISKAQKEQLDFKKIELQDEKDKIKKMIDLLEQVRILLQKTADFAREQSKQRIESFVTNCLQYIFDNDIRFEIELSESNSRTKAEFYVISEINGQEYKTKPEEARGGGVVDIISIALRIAMLQCSTLEIDGPIILDEPAKHVSDEYIVQVSEFLKQASSTFERQIIMVTHSKHLSEIADKAFRVELIEGNSNITIE